MTQDGVAVAAHSSPLEIWESLDCYGKKIENMTAAQVTSCHMLPSLETFPRVDDVLAWAKGKLVVMLTVKSPRAFMYELEPTYSNASAAQVAAMIKTKLRPAGIRAFAASAANPITSTVQNHLGLFSQGFEVIMSYNLANGVAARIKINKAAGISPPW